LVGGGVIQSKHPTFVLIWLQKCPFLPHFYIPLQKKKIAAVLKRVKKPFPLSE